MNSISTKMEDNALTTRHPLLVMGWAEELKNVRKPWITDHGMMTTDTCATYLGTNRSENMIQLFIDQECMVMNSHTYTQVQEDKK